MALTHKRGFTLIEGLVALFVFSLLVTTFYNVFTQTMVHMQDGKQRRAAVSLANERMEHYRNLAYAEVGTTTNAPFGDIVADENVTINEMFFRVITSVILVDDPWDGRAVNGTDVIPNDYKRVSVSVIWDQCTSASYTRGMAEYGGECSVERVRLVSQFVPPGGLETVESGGILSINVLDASANAIPNAILTIHDSVRNETFVVQTDSTGNYMYIGAPACQNCYEINVEKSGYETLSTKLSPANKTVSTEIGDVSYFPRFIHQSVTDSTMTTMSFIMQEYSDLTLTTEDPFENVISDVDFSVQGGRVMGTNLNENPLYTEAEVYGFYDDVVTDVSGEVVIRTDTNDDESVTSADHVNPGVFTFGLDELETNYVFLKMSPGLDNNRQKTSVNAGTAVEAKMILLDKNYKSILIRVVNDEGVPANGAYVYLYDNNDVPTYSSTQQTDVYGYAYFPMRSESEPYDIVPLLEEDMEYEYIVSAGGYETYSDVITVEDDKLYDINVILTPES
ncbi:MAG: prepilin-type N-terminal cleavage/methylation domain-containing protein [Parcubacteria group bacterium]|jgi:prepilin-type N-terminal cleavage/methylation domain-containing protein